MNKVSSESTKIEKHQSSFDAISVRFKTQFPLLRVLDLSYNNLIDFPPQIFDHTTIEEIDLSHNAILHFTQKIDRLAKLQKLNLLDNPAASDLVLSHIVTGTDFVHKN